MNPDLDTLATSLYVKVDDVLSAYPEWAPPRPAVGIAPRLGDAEVITLAVIQALLRFTSEARFLRLRPHPSQALVSVLADPFRLQQATAWSHRNDAICDRVAGPGQPVMV